MAQGPYINSPQIIGQMASAACGQQQREPSIARELEIPARMGDLQHLLNGLGEQVAALVQRLEPVCAVSPNTRGDKTIAGAAVASREPNSQIGAQLVDAANKLRTIREMVSDLTIRLEV